MHCETFEQSLADSLGLEIFCNLEHAHKRLVFDDLLRPSWKMKEFTSEKEYTQWIEMQLTERVNLLKQFAPKMEEHRLKYRIHNLERELGRWGKCRAKDKKNYRMVVKIIKDVIAWLKEHIEARHLHPQLMYFR